MRRLLAALLLVAGIALVPATPVAAAPATPVAAAPYDCHVTIGSSSRSTRSICYRGTGSHRAGELCVVGDSYTYLFGAWRGIFQPSYTGTCYNGYVVSRWVQVQ